MYSIFDSYVHKHYICFKAGDCRLLASVGVYSYYVKRKKSTSSSITCNWHFIWTDVWSEYRGVVGLMKDTGIQMCFQNFIKWQRAGVKISHMIRKIVLFELIISKEVEVFQKITILKKLEVRGFGALFHAPLLIHQWFAFQKVLVNIPATPGTSPLPLYNSGHWREPRG